MEKTTLERVLAEYEHRRDVLLETIEQREEGKMFSGKSEGGRWMNTTDQTVAEDKKDLAELERLIAETKEQLKSK